MLSLSVHFSIFEIEPADWDAIVEDGRVWQTHAALALLEQGGLEDCWVRYLVLRGEGGRVAAHTAAYAINVDFLIFSSGLLLNVTDRLRNFVPSLLRLRMLECGCPVSAGPSICLRESIHLTDVLGPINTALEQIATEERIKFIILRDFYDEQLSELASAGKHGFQLVSGLPSTRLFAPWRSFEDYINAMRATYRSKLRKAQKRATQQDLKANVRSDFSEIADHLSKQWNNQNAAAKEIRIERLTSKFYSNASTAFGPSCRAIEIVQGSKRLAHALVVIDGRIMRWMFFGRDDPGARDGAYFLAIETIIRLAIEENVEMVEMGITSYRPKTDFGAEIVPLSMLVRVRGLLRFTPIVRLFKWLNPVPGKREKKVFKPSNT